MSMARLLRTVSFLQMSALFTLIAALVSFLVTSDPVLAIGFVVLALIELGLDRVVKSRGRVPRGTYTAFGLILVGIFVLLGVDPAAASVTIDINTDPLFESVNTYLPTFFNLLAIGGGITIAVAIVRLVINSIVDAF